MNRPVRRLLLVVAVLLGVGLSASSCSTFDQSRVAQVGDTKLTRNEFDDIVTSELGHTLLGIQETNGSLGGEAARTLVTAWTTTQLAKQMVDQPLDTASVSESSATRFGAEWQAAPESLKTLWVEYEAVNQLMQTGQLDVTKVREHLTQSSVYVNPRIGRWDPMAAEVVAVG